MLDCPAKTFLGAGVKTVVLFFTKGEPTQQTWFYQLDPGRSLGKTNPLNDSDLKEFVEYQGSFEESEKSWSVEVGELGESLDLQLKNPNKKEEAPLRSPMDIISEIIALDKESEQILSRIEGLIE